MAWGLNIMNKDGRLIYNSERKNLNVHYVIDVPVERTESITFLNTAYFAAGGGAGSGLENYITADTVIFFKDLRSGSDPSQLMMEWNYASAPPKFYRISTTGDAGSPSSIRKGDVRVYICRPGPRVTSEKYGGVAYDASGNISWTADEVPVNIVTFQQAWANQGVGAVVAAGRYALPSSAILARTNRVQVTFGAYNEGIVVKNVFEQLVDINGTMSSFLMDVSLADSIISPIRI